MAKIKNLTGQRFGKLVVINQSNERKKGRVCWYCKCDCGGEIITQGRYLQSGGTKSCGCLLKEKVTKHGLGKSRAYSSWHDMLRRCYNPKNHNYEYYGEKGIKVCERWWSFENFYEDMGEKPEGFTLERINNNKDYFPDNCRWASWKDQMQNRRFKGYYWDEATQKWKAKISCNYKVIHLGSFDTPEEARQAYLEAKKKYHPNAHIPEEN